MNCGLIGEMRDHVSKCRIEARGVGFTSFRELVSVSGSCRVFFLSSPHLFREQAFCSTLVWSKSAQLLSGQCNFINSWDSLDELMLTCPLLIWKAAVPWTLLQTHLLLVSASFQLKTHFNFQTNSLFILQDRESVKIFINCSAACGDAWWCSSTTCR